MLMVELFEKADVFFEFDILLGIIRLSYAASDESSIVDFFVECA